MKERLILHRSKRQLAKIREHQPAALTPMSMSAPPTPVPPKTEAEIAAEREERIEIEVRAQGKVFEAKHFMLVAERERDEAKRELKEERQAHVEECRRLKAENECLRQDLAAKHYNRESALYRGGESAEARKQKILADVADGKLCANAAAPPDEIQQEASNKLERMNIPCQQN